MASQSQQGTSMFGKPAEGSQQQSGGIFGQPQQPQPSNPFVLGQQQQKPNSMFGTSNQQQQQPQQSSLFGSLVPQPQQSSIFGTSNQQQQPQQGSPFGTLGLAHQQPKPNSIFGTSNQQQQQPQQGSPFGSLAQQAQQNSILGSSNQQQQPQQSSIFGSLGQQQQKPEQSSIFGAPSQPQQQTQQSSLFSSFNQSQQQPQQNSIFGTSNQQQQQQPQSGSDMFAHLRGSLNQTQQQQQQQPQPGTDMFAHLSGSLNQTQQQPQQTSLSGPLFESIYQSGQQQGQQQGSGIPQPQTRLWQQGDSSPHLRPVTAQMDAAFSKWNPESSNTLFQTYLYNYVPPDQAPFYSPGPQDDEGKWEEALRKKPAPGAIPVLVKGFQQLGRRVVIQHAHLQILQGRLHEIDGGLRDLLKKHDLQISIRAAECKRKHLRLNHQCLLLAGKVQVLRNRGYSMDSAEEELKEKMLRLERTVFDPALNGRGEEIWARMVSLRERSRQLQRESEKVGKSMAQGQVEEIDEEVMKRAKKILEDYSSQLSHLTKELSQIQKDFAEWEQPPTGGSRTGR